LETDRPTISTTEAGRMLGVKHETIRAYWERGLIEGYLTIPDKHGRLRLYRESVEKYARQRENRPRLEA
jgi:predicted site-specific integrase-resolvase